MSAVPFRDARRRPWGPECDNLLLQGVLTGIQWRRLLAITILIIILVSICVGLRFYARRLGEVKWGVDDTLILPGTIFCLALCTCALSKSDLYMTDENLRLTCIPAQLQIAGVGYHQAFIAATAPDEPLRQAKFVPVTSLVYLAAVLFPKLAILAMYLRVFISRPYRVAC